MGTEVSSTNMGVAGTMMHGMLCAGMHGHIKANDDDTDVNVGVCELHGEGDRCGRRVVGTQEMRGDGGVQMCSVQGVTIGWHVSEE